MALSTSAMAQSQLTSDVVKPSFDCAKATTTTEKAICASPDLARLDSQIAQQYRRARSLADASLKATLLTEQRAWLKDRSKCGADPSCLAASMQKRVQELTSVQLGEHTSDSVGTISRWLGMHVYRAGVFSGSLQITATAGLPKVDLDMTREAGMGTCTADITGSLSVQGVNATIAPPFATRGGTDTLEPSTEPCALSFRLNPDGSISVTERVVGPSQWDTSCAEYHGARCRFDGEYQLVKN